jgi:hypothetical protein
MKALLLALTVTAAAILTGCAGDDATTFRAADTAPVALPVASAAKHIKAASKQADSIYRLGAAPKSPEVARLQLTLNSAEADTVQAQAQLALLSATESKEVEAGNAEIKKQTARAEKAEAANKKYDTKHLRDIEAMAAIFVIGALCCLFGPLLHAAYPALSLVPDELLDLCGGLGIGIVMAGVFGLLILFGIL